MSYINNNAYPTAFPAAAMPEAETGAMPFGVGPQASGGRRNDGIVPIFRFPQPQPIGFPQPQPRPIDPPSPFSNPGNGATGMPGFMNLINGFIDALQTLLANLGKEFGFGGTGTPSGTPETYVRNADASSAGDPHDAFNGTNGSGGTIAGGKWDNMQSHADLLDSDSFGGGYTVSTTTTTSNAKGVTMNASANVALDGGATDITMNSNGSFSVSSYGHNMQLQRGQSVQLGDGARVSLGADDALTVSDTAASGGTLSTRLTANGHGGVDVTASAQNVDLGGYLVNHTDGAPWPTPVMPLPMSPVFDPYSSETWPTPSILSNAAEPQIALE